MPVRKKPAPSSRPKSDEPEFEQRARHEPEAEPEAEPEQHADLDEAAVHAKKKDKPRGGVLDLDMFAGAGISQHATAAGQFSTHRMREPVRVTTPEPELTQEQHAAFREEQAAHNASDPAFLAECARQTAEAAKRRIRDRENARVHGAGMV
jgi:hypothetical protein